MPVLHHAHCGPRDWCIVRTTPNAPVFGVELELESYGPSFRQKIMELVAETIRPQPIFEEDGSLSWTRGVEIIFHPADFPTLKSWFSALLPKIKPFCSRRQREGVGIHISYHENTDVDTAYLLWIKMIHFYNTIDHFEFLRRLARRDSVYGPPTTKMDFGMGYDDAFIARRVTYRNGFLESDKYMPVYVSKTETGEFRFEHRIFKTVLNLNHITRTIRFVGALHVAARNYPSRAISLDLVQKLM